MKICGVTERSGTTDVTVGDAQQNYFKSSHEYGPGKSLLSQLQLSSSFRNFKAAITYLLTCFPSTLGAEIS
jgi:hypothetical protein